MNEELEKQYKSIMLALDNINAEIACIVSQGKRETTEFDNLARAQSKLSTYYELLENILNKIKRYEIVKSDINVNLEISRNKTYQQKQHELDKKYEEIKNERRIRNNI